MSNEHGPVMSVERAKIILETFGGDEAAWPAAERPAMQAVLQSNPELRQAWREAVALDRMLANNVGAEPSPDFMSRLLADANHVQASHMQTVRTRSVAAMERASIWRQLLELLWPYGSPSIPAGALAASIVLGVSVGALSVDTETTITDNSAYEMVAFAVGDSVLGEDWQ